VKAKRVSRTQGGPSGRDEPSEIRRTFARNLRQAREAAGLTQAALARATACTHRLLANIETRAANVKLDTITRLARALGFTEIDLLQPDMKIVPAKLANRPPAELASKTEPTKFRLRFAQNLRARREAAGLFQKALAKVAGIRLSSEGDIEVHALNVTSDTVTLLAKALGVTEIDLLGRTTVEGERSRNRDEAGD
jgi:transcriptional regulator with XRE-family HTH domain